MTRKNDERSDVQWGAGLAVARDARERAGHGGRQRSRRRAGRRGAATMLTKLWVVALLAAQNAQPAFADEEGLAEADGEDFGGDDYDGDYGDVGDYGGGGYGGGYGDDEYGGGGDPTPAWETVESFDGIAEFVNQDETEPAVVGFFDADRDADQQKVYEEVAEGSRYDFRFALVTDEAARTAAKLQKGPAVLVYAPPRFVKEGVDKKRARYPSAKLDAEALKKFIFKRSVPLVGQKTWKSGERYDKQGVPVVTLFAAIDLEKNAKGFDYFANRLRKVAADYVGKLSFNIGDKEDFSYQLEDYGIELPAKKDVGVGAKDGNKYYRMEDKFNVDNVRKFAQAVVDGALEPKIKEEPSYDDDHDASGEADDSDYEESDVTVLTDANFADETDGKDAMLEFYAPWCGHCQALKPTYKELGTRLAGADVVVGAMDATANSPPDGYDVQGYPTLIFKTASGKTTSYDGDRDVDSMVAYIKEHAEAESVKSEL